MKPATVLIGDDHVILLEAFQKLIEPHCSVLATAADGRELLAKALQLRPDVVITDINMPGLNGLEVCERLAKQVPETKIIFLTVSEDIETAEAAFCSGASGYVLKKAAAGDLFRAIQTVRMGRPYITPLLSTKPVNVFISQARRHKTKPLLTMRQREVLQLLADGKCMKEAADVLGISRGAAEHFLKQGYKSVYNIAGGIDAWSKDVDPSVKRYYARARRAAAARTTSGRGPPSSHQRSGRCA